MTSSSKPDKQKNFSMAKAILAVLRQSPEIGKERLLSHRYIKLLCSNKHKNTYRSCIHRLHRAKLIKKEYNSIISLAEGGEKQALFAFIEAELSLHQKGRENKWDGGWRMIFFDIPEEKRKHRDHLRRVLKSIGFHEFQKSIWIYPFPVPPFLKELLFEDNVKPYVRFVTTNLVDRDDDIKKIFKLP